MAAALQARGVAPGDHVALLGPTSRPFVTAIQAIWLTGATLVVLPLPMRLGSLEEFVAPDPDPDPQRRHRPARRRPRPGPVPRAAARRPAVGAPDRSAPRSWPSHRRRPRPARGRPGQPGRAPVHQRLDVRAEGRDAPAPAICANLDGVCQAGRARPGRRRPRVLAAAVPRHGSGRIRHDPADDRQSPVVLAAPQDFLGAPVRWMQWLSAFRGTATAGPTSPGHSPPGRCARRRPRPVPAADRPERRRAGRPRQRGGVHRRRVGRFGLRPGAVFPAFGMAEVVIGGTFPPPRSTACAPTASTGACSRPSATPPPREPGDARVPSPCPARAAAAGPRDPHRRPGHRPGHGPTARSASSRSGATR